MLRLIYALSAILALATPFTAADAATVWQGEAVVVAVSGCPTDARRQIGVGTVMKSVLRPRLLDNQSLDTRVSFSHESGGFFAIVLPGGAMPTATYAAFGSTQSGFFWSVFTGTYSGFAQVPPALAATNQFARLSGTIAKFMFIDSCTVTFRATYSKRPAGE
jgi:hypothetical protein